MTITVYVRIWEEFGINENWVQSECFRKEIWKQMDLCASLINTEKAIADQYELIYRHMLRQVQIAGKFSDLRAMYCASKNKRAIRSTPHAMTLDDEDDLKLTQATGKRVKRDSNEQQK